MAIRAPPDHARVAVDQSLKGDLVGSSKVTVVTTVVTGISGARLGIIAVVDGTISGDLEGGGSMTSGGSGVPVLVAVGVIVGAMVGKTTGESDGEGVGLAAIGAGIVGMLPPGASPPLSPPPLRYSRSQAARTV
jgi:hypothetical protein